MVDTLRADWTSPYGFESDTTPELSRWAERGVVFESVRAQSSWTKISMASFLTSLWPRSHGIAEVRDGLGEGAVTLAEALKEAGYATAAVQTNGWLHPSFGFQQGFDRYLFPLGGDSPAFEKPSLWAHADRVLEEAFRVIDAHGTEAGDTPLFLYMHFMDVHEYAAPPEFKRFGTDGRGAYLASIRWIDDALERVRTHLERAGRLDRTLLVLASDHGETFGENGVFGHARNVLTPVVHVPLVIRLPFELEPAVRISAQVAGVDVAPTLLELLGIAVPPTFQGRSLLDWVEGRERPDDRTSFARLGHPLFPDSFIQDVVSDGTWTYARNEPLGEEHVRGRSDPAEQLFDRRVDPWENVDLIPHEPAQAARLRDALESHMATAPDDRVRAQGVRIDPAIADRLRAMGYVE